MNLGFEGRKFLTEQEWMTYLRRLPVRFVRHKLADTCCVCGKQASEDNPLQGAHKVPFSQGVRDYRLTPDWLDSENNIATAHRKNCNKAVELTPEQIRDLLQL
jgi:hypothetical protein